jgi:hypothetical protein
MKTSYRVKLGVAVYYEVEVNVDADDAVQAMNVSIDDYQRNLLPPVRMVCTTSPAIISVSKKNA